MNRKFSPKVKQIISRSREEAMRLGHDFIGTEHLLLGIMQDTDSLAVRDLESLDIDGTGEVVDVGLTPPAIGCCLTVTLAQFP